jgi:HlyD family secretion protein
MLNKGRSLKSGLTIILLFVMGLAGVGLIAFFRSAKAEEQAGIPVIRPAVVRAEALEVRSYKITESFHGIIQANARIDLGFQIPGRVSQLGATRESQLRENDAVESGQVLAMLEPLRYQAAVDAAEAQIEAAKAGVDAAQALVNEAQAKYDGAKKEADRYRELFQKKAASAMELDRAETAEKSAEAVLSGMKAGLASATAAYATGRNSATIANVNLQDATLKAPRSALVAVIPVEVGTMVQPGQTVITLVDLSRVKLVVGVVERKLPLIRKGQKVDIEVQALAANQSVVKDPVKAAALGKPRSGVITIVPPAADPVTGLFNVEIELDNPDGLLRPGMIGKASVVVQEKKAFAIPVDAVTKQGDQYFAYFVAHGYETGLDLGGLGKTSFTVPAPVARKLPFTPVAVDREYYLITDLPDTLDQLVVEGQSRLADGQPVHVLDETVAHTDDATNP